MEHETMTLGELTELIVQLLREGKQVIVRVRRQQPYPDRHHMPEANNFSFSPAGERQSLFGP